MTADALLRWFALSHIESPFLGVGMKFLFFAKNNETAYHDQLKPCGYPLRNQIDQSPFKLNAP